MVFEREDPKIEALELNLQWLLGEITPALCLSLLTHKIEKHPSLPQRRPECSRSPHACPPAGLCSSYAVGLSMSTALCPVPSKTVSRV